MKNPLPMTRSGYPTPPSILTPRFTQMVTVPLSMSANDGDASASGPGSSPRLRIKPATVRVTAGLPAAMAAARVSARSAGVGSPASRARSR
jgi:hypothetical protein